MVAAGKGHPYSSTIAAHLQLVNDFGDLRNARAFYSAGPTSYVAIFAFPM